MMIDGAPILLTVCTTPNIENPKSNEHFISEDNKLFIKILHTIRFKDKNGKKMKIRVDDAKVCAMINKMVAKTNNPVNADDTMEYELVEE